MKKCKHWWILGDSKHVPDINRVITDGHCKVCGEERRFVSKPVPDWMLAIHDLTVEAVPIEEGAVK